MNLVAVSLATPDWSPDPNAFYEYIVGSNGLFIHAQDDRLFAAIPIAPAHVNNALSRVEPTVSLLIPRVPGALLRLALESARRHLPNEAMYQFSHDKYNYVLRGWTCRMPNALATPTALAYENDPHAVIDLHSHGRMHAFFSSTDDADEQGFRLYVVIGNVDTDRPTIAARVGVYGHHMSIDPSVIFDDLGPFQTNFQITETL